MICAIPVEPITNMIVYSSSGGAIYGEPAENPVAEDHPVIPLCPYGASKYCGEKYIQMYHAAYGMDYNILRYGNVYGPRQDPLGEAGVVAIFTKAIMEGRQPVIFGDGRQTRDFCYVGDVAAANLCAMEETASATRVMILEGRVLLEEYSGSMMGTPFTGRGMLGFDNVSGKYWGTWNDSMSTGIMFMEGSCDEKGSCRYTGTWNDPIKKGPVTWRFMYSWPKPNVQVLHIYGPGRDGKEMKMMEMTYTRK